MRGRPIQEIAVGDAAELTRVATPRDVAEFIDSIGDHNPIHQDRAYAASTRFEKPIVPGMWTASLISAVLGTQLPGPGCIYISLQITFTRPVYGDRITARVEVVERLPDRNRVRLKAVCTNQECREVLIGDPCCRRPGRRSSTPGERRARPRSPTGPCSRPSGPRKPPAPGRGWAPPGCRNGTRSPAGRARTTPADHWWRRPDFRLKPQWPALPRAAASSGPRASARGPTGGWRYGRYCSSSPARSMLNAIDEMAGTIDRHPSAAAAHYRGRRTPPSRNAFMITATMVNVGFAAAAEGKRAFEKTPRRSTS